MSLLQTVGTEKETNLNRKTRRKVLVVEDDKDQSSILAQKLCRAGYDVDCAYDGDEGLEKGLQRDPDLVLLDLGLPRLEGKWVLWRLRASKKTRRLPVVVVTGESDTKVLEETRQLGVVDILQKPMPVAKIAGAVNRILGTPLLDKPALKQPLSLGGGRMTYRSRIFLLAILLFLFFAASLGNQETRVVPAAPLDSGERSWGDFPLPRDGVFLAASETPLVWRNGVWFRKGGAKKLAETPWKF